MQLASAVPTQAQPSHEAPSAAAAALVTAETGFDTNRAGIPDDGTCQESRCSVETTDVVSDEEWYLSCFRVAWSRLQSMDDTAMKAALQVQFLSALQARARRGRA